MKILHVVQSLDPAWGGMARVVPMLATQLAASGDECSIATLTGGRYGNATSVTDAQVLTFSAAGSSRLGRSKEFDATIEELVRAHDLVHLHGLWTGQNWSAGEAARKLGKPYIMTPHSMMMPWAWRRSRWKKRLAGWVFEHRNLREATRLHALAEQEAAAMRELGFNDRIVVIPNGLHAAEFDREGQDAIDSSATPSPRYGDSISELERKYPEWQGHRLIVMLGRISLQKGLADGLQACFDVFPIARDWHLVIAGPDEFGLQAVVEAAVRRKGVTDRVTLTGMLARHEVRALLARASLLLQPSLSEGLSMSILEALASGVPVLISTACNMPEVEEVGAGRVVTPRRAEITAALREMLSMDEPASKAMGRRGQALVRERFDWKELIPRYQEMYHAAHLPLTP